MRIFGRRALRVTVAGVLCAGSFGALSADDSGAVVTSVGSCSGHRGIVSNKSTFVWPGDGKPAGVTDKNHDAATSFKGAHAHNAAVGTVGGTCTFTQAVANSSTTFAAAGSRTIAKWGGKSVTPGTDCLFGDGNSGEWPASGKLSFSFTDLTKLDAYVTDATPSTAPQDIRVAAGVVTKGVGVGANVRFEYGVTPAVKDKLVITDWDGTEMVTELLTGGTPAARAVIQGYGIDGTVINCQAVTEPVADTVNIRYLVANGSGLTPLLQGPIAGTEFTIGTA
jgi:hypothetical protein